MTDAKKPHCILYTFSYRIFEGDALVGVNSVKVARITDSIQADWHLWPEKYIEELSGAEEGTMALREIASIELIDDREVRS